MAHHAPTVAQAAKLFKTRFGKKLFELKDETITDFESMFTLENTRKVKKGVPLSFDEPKCLLRTENFPSWSLPITTTGALKGDDDSNDHDDEHDDEHGGGGDGDDDDEMVTDA